MGREGAVFCFGEQEKKKKKTLKLSNVVMSNLIFNVLAIAAGVVIPGLFLYAITRSILAAIHGLDRQ
jgi:hypothetical protein